MQLVSLKRSKADKAEDQAESVGIASQDQPDYPYGTSLCLDEDELAKLGIDATPAAGTPVALQGMGTVTGVREEQVDGKVRRHVDIQITDLALSLTGRSMAERMYGSGDKS